MDIRKIFDQSLWFSRLEDSLQDTRKSAPVTVGQGRFFTVYRYLEGDLADFVVAVSKPIKLGLAMPRFWVPTIQELGRSGWPLVPPMAAYIWKRNEGDAVVWVKPWLRHRVCFEKGWPESLAASGLELERLLKQRGLRQTDAWDIRSRAAGSEPYVVDWSDLVLMSES